MEEPTIPVDAVEHLDDSTFYKMYQNGAIDRNLSSDCFKAPNLENLEHDEELIMQWNDEKDDDGNYIYKCRFFTDDHDNAETVCPEIVKYMKVKGGIVSSVQLQNLLKHEEGHMSIYKCRLCKTCYTCSGLKLHLKKVNHYRDDVCKIPVFSPASRCYRNCDWAIDGRICNEPNSRNNIQRYAHYFDHHLGDNQLIRPFVCLACPRFFYSYAVVRNHLIIEHEEGDRYYLDRIRGFLGKLLMKSDGHDTAIEILVPEYIKNFFPNCDYAYLRPSTYEKYGRVQPGYMKSVVKDHYEKGQTKLNVIPFLNKEMGIYDPNNTLFEQSDAEIRDNTAHIDDFNLRDYIQQIQKMFI